ncbi:MAG: thiol:disulfide interchange protein DsbA/DsbL [Pseudomonadota bacterium]
MRQFLLSVLLLSLAGTTAAQDFQEGVHYKLIEPAQPTNNEGTVEVVEVFSYACPHCASFQPFIESWVESAPENVDFRRIPVVFRASWEPFARAYYTAEAMDILDDTHEAIFDALHKERRQLRSNDDLADFVAENSESTSREDYLKLSKSFAIETKLRRGMTQVQRFGVDATPSVIINGKYRATATMAGSVNRLLELMNYLVGLENAGAGAAETAEASSD